MNMFHNKDNNEIYSSLSKLYSKYRVTDIENIDTVIQEINRIVSQINNFKLTKQNIDKLFEGSFNDDQKENILRILNTTSATGGSNILNIPFKKLNKNQINILLNNTKLRKKYNKVWKNN